MGAYFTRMRILLVNHSTQTCGVYQYGLNLYYYLAGLNKWEIDYAETSNSDHVVKAIKKSSPDKIIYNWHPWTLSWCDDAFVRSFPNIIHGAIWHDPVNLPPTPMRNLISRNPDEVESFGNERNIFKSYPIMLNYTGPFAKLESIPIIGTAGFVTNHKNFSAFIERVQDEFDEAEIRMHVPAGAFASNIDQVRHTMHMLEVLIRKPHIKLRYSTDFLHNTDLVEWHAQNNLNVFIYEELQGSGVSAAVEKAINAEQPVAVNKSYMFRHLWKIKPSILVEENSLRTIMQNGFTPLVGLYSDWINLNASQWDYIFNEMN